MAEIGIPEINILGLIEKIKKRQNENSKIGSQTDTESLKASKNYHFEDVGIAKRYQGVDLNNLNLDTKKEIVIKRYLDKFVELEKQGIGLNIIGNYGTGKTSIGVAILKEVIKKGYHGYLIPLPIIGDKLLRLRAYNNLDAIKFEERLRNVKLVIFDDVGSESDNWIRDKFESILFDRYEKMLPSILTTNYTLDELKKNYQARTIDRLEDTNYTIILNGESKRKKNEIIK